MKTHLLTNKNARTIQLFYFSLSLLSLLSFAVIFFMILITNSYYTFSIVLIAFLLHGSPAPTFEWKKQPY